MKIFLSSIAFAFTFFLSSCSVSGSDSNMSNASLNSFLTTRSNWHVTYFLGSGTDKTANFSGYSFSFNTNGTLTGTNNGTIVSGSWVILVENDGLKLQLTFASPANFAELNEDWKVIESTASKTRLQNGGDYLTFE